MGDVVQALKYLYQSGIINDLQFQDFFNRCNDVNADFDLIKEELIKIYDNYNNINNVSSDFDFEIIEVDDPEGLTGIVPIDMLNDVDNSQSTLEQVSSKSIGGKQKKIGAFGNIPWSSDESGFMSFLFISFLTGISIGIISMIFINFIA